MHKLVRITTVPISLKILLRGQLRFMGQHYRVLGVSSGGTDLEDVAQEEGIETIEVNMTRFISPFADLKALVKLYAIFVKERPLIVHSHTPKAGLLGMLAARMARVPVRLHTVAGLPLLEAKGVKRALLNFTEKITYSCANKVYPNSHLLSDIILKRGFCRKEKLKVIGTGSSNGIDTSYFNPALFEEEDKCKIRKRLGISENDFLFIFVGRIVSHKGINELISVFKRLTNNYAHIRLLLVGPQETNIDPLSKETQLTLRECGQIIETGFQTDVRPYFAISNVLVFPSYREGFPNVVMQAGAMGLPAIVSDINGCNEIIVDGENGLVVSPRDNESLMHAMKRLLTDEDCYNTLMRHARDMITDRYEQKYVWESILAEYRYFENCIA